MDSAAQAIFADCRLSLENIEIDRLEPLRGSTVYMTGATGFVGTWLLAVLAFLNDAHGFGIRVTGIARRPSVLRDRAPFLADRKDVELIQADVRQLIEFPAATRWVIHAAGSPDSRHHATNPIDTASVIAEGTARVLRLAEQAEDLRRLLHFSSGLVMARAAAEPNARRVGASSVYTEAKSFSEALCAAYRTQARLPIVITRPFTFIGPFQSLDAPWAANNFLHAAINSQPLKILGSGDTSRAYLYGSDVAVLSLLQLVGGNTGDTYDLGGIEALPLIELARIVVSEAGKPLEIRANTAHRETGISRLVPEMGRSQSDFGWKPAFTPVEAVRRMLQWHVRQQGQVSR